MQRASAVCHSDCFGAAQYVELFEYRLDMAFDGDFSDTQGHANKLVGLALRQQPQYFQCKW